MFRHILVATDFAPASSRALEVAMELGKDEGSRLTILHVCEIPGYAYAGIEFSPVDLLAPIAEVAEKRLDDLLVATRERFPEVAGAFKLGSPHEQILAVAGQLGCDLVVMGTHGRHGFAHAALGSVAEKVVRSCPVPVLTVHARDQ
jgi:nucleotide-binding universal stress UspA family protein